MAFTQKNTWSNTDYALAAAVMCLMGGYYWAIRGTGGYGGETGGALAGLGWALLWYAFSRWGGEGGSFYICGESRAPVFKMRLDYGE